MKNKNILNYALINSLLATLYIILVAMFMYYSNQGIFQIAPSIFIPIVMLMLFVLSAAITGSLIFGRPVLWYLDGKKKEALNLFIYTMAIFFILTLVIFVLLIIINII